MLLIWSVRLLCFIYLRASDFHRLSYSYHNDRFEALVSFCNAINSNSEVVAPYPRPIKPDICCFSAKHFRASVDWSSWSQKDVSELGHIFSFRFILLWASALNIRLSVTVYGIGYSCHIHIKNIFAVIVIEPSSWVWKVTTKNILTGLAGGWLKLHQLCNKSFRNYLRL